MVGQDGWMMGRTDGGSSIKGGGELGTVCVSLREIGLGHSVVVEGALKSIL